MNTTLKVSQDTRKHVRKVWHRLQIGLATVLLVALLFSQYTIHQQQHKITNLRDQHAYDQQLLKNSEKELKQLQREIIEKQENELVASRGAKRNATELTPEEFDLVCRVVAAESRGQSVKGQLIVAQCIHDRLVSNCYGSTVSDVVTAPGQFAAPYKGDLEDYPAVTYSVYSVFNQGIMPLNADVRVFFNPKTSKPSAIKPLRDKYDYITTEGNHEVRGYM